MRELISDVISLDVTDGVWTFVIFPRDTGHRALSALSDRMVACRRHPGAAAIRAGVTSWVERLQRP